MRRSGITAVLAAGLLAFAGCSGDDGNADKAAKAKKPRVAKKTEKKDVVVAAAYRYDPTDKPDPFKSWVKNVADYDPDSVSSPLERFDLSQLEVTGIVWHMDIPRALVKDPTGKGYIVNEGTAVGKNKGRIVRIEDNMLVVKETYVDFQDRATTKEVELKLYGKNGG